MRLNRRGVNRWVLLVGFYAFKFPNPSTWRQVLFGILNNLNERDWSKSKPGTCPVLWSSPGGIVIVMPRVEILDANSSSSSTARRSALPTVSTPSKSRTAMVGSATGSSPSTTVGSSPAPQPLEASPLLVALDLFLLGYHRR